MQESKNTADTETKAHVVAFLKKKDIKGTKKKMQGGRWEGGGKTNQCFELSGSRRGKMTKLVYQEFTF